MNVNSLLSSTRKTSNISDIDQRRSFTRSYTVAALPPIDASEMAHSPQELEGPGPQLPNIPHKSSRRNLRSVRGDLSIKSPGGSKDKLVRPMPTSRSVSSHFASRANRRSTQSSISTSAKMGSSSYKGASPIKKGKNSPRKTSQSVTSVLASSHDYTCRATDSTNASGPLKTSRSKAKNIFAKFADVLTEHFTAKGSRKGNRSSDPIETLRTSREMTIHQNAHGQLFNKISFSTMPLTVQDDTHVMPDSPAGDDEISKEEARLTKSRVQTGSSTVMKRLTMADEVDFQNSQALEDPFSETSSGQHTTEFEARLKSRQGARRGPVSTDPFQAEKILETSVDAMLTTPPVGCSTPQRRPLSSSQCETPTHVSHTSDHVADQNTFSAGVPCAEVDPRRRIPTQRQALRKEHQPVNDGRKRGLARRTNSRPENSATSDSTRLSSYPPGSTIRHVPRSMGRLIEGPTHPNLTVERTKTLPLRRKKHPSPSKGQLELFGRYMERNLAVGVFKDADELGMSFSFSPQPSARTLSPRDMNRLIRNTAGSNADFRTGYTLDGKHPALPKSRSRIPQPVRQLSRSRTDTAFARDFLPLKKGDSTMGDELQWDVSAYKIGHRCNHCGNTNQIL